MSDIKHHGLSILCFTNYCLYVPDDHQKQHKGSVQTVSRVGREMSYDHMTSKNARARTIQECVIDGLLQTDPGPELQIIEIPGKGRSVVVQSPVAKGGYLCEYEFSCTYPRAQREAKELEYAANDEACMIFEVQTRNGWICLDATRKTDSIGRLLNHAPPRLATARAHKAVLLNGEWRVGFYAIRDLSIGEEVTWDYNCPPEGQQWLFKRPGMLSCVVSF